MTTMAPVEVGAGPPLVLIPGIQGRWEYLQPAIDALGRFFRVLTFSLCGERDAGAPFDPALGMDNYCRQVAAILDRAKLNGALICGVSFGGLAAIRFAATRPERTAALILVSTPGPDWHLRPRHHTYTRLPWLFGPLFLIESPFRLRAELWAAFPDWRSRCRFAVWQLRTLARAPLSPARMGVRASLIPDPHVLDDCARITARTLIVTGEPGLDHVVPTTATSTYTTLIARACQRKIDNTGHLGSITKPEVFASIVGEFFEPRQGDPSRGFR